MPRRMSGLAGMVLADSGHLKLLIQKFWAETRSISRSNTTHYVVIFRKIYFVVTAPTNCGNRVR